MTLKKDPSFDEKLRNSVNFNASEEKSENLHFDELFL